MTAGDSYLPIKWWAHCGQPGFPPRDDLFLLFRQGRRRRERFVAGTSDGTGVGIVVVVLLRSALRVLRSLLGVPSHVTEALRRLAIRRPLRELFFHGSLWGE